MRLVKFWLPPVFWATLIFILSSRPTTSTSEIYWQDFVVKKIAHIVEYFILTTLLYRAFTNNKVEKKKAAYWAITLAVLYGISDEYHQSFTPGRDPQARDIIFDAIGSGLAIYAIWRYLPKAPRKLRILAKNLQIS